MPRNGSGVYSLAESPFIAGTVILSADMNSDLDDIADALTDSVASDGQTQITGQMLGAPGSVSAPAWSFAVDPDTGIYRNGANGVGVAAGGINVQNWSSGASSITGILVISAALTVSSGGITLTAGVYTSPVGSVGAPAIAFVGDLDSGLYWIGANNIGIAVNGAKVLDIATIGLSVTGTSSASTGFKVGANPTATPGKAMTMQVLTSGTAATYTTPAGVCWLRVRAAAGGGGGAGTAGSAGNGTNTLFDGIQANPGAGGVNGSGSTGGIGGAGGTGGGGAANLRLPGARGGDGGFSSNSSSGNGGEGGITPFCGGAGQSNTTGYNAVANSGGGGSGAGNNGYGSGGGGSGEYFELIIAAPAATYLYTVGAAGSPATNGGSGAAGRIVVEEFYS